MSNERQIAANRQNAQRSSGPRTDEGKARAAANALKHGLTGKCIVLPEEDPHEFDVFRSDLLEDLAPEGALQGVFAEKIVADAWRLRRIPELEAAVHRREYQLANILKASRAPLRDFRRIESLKERLLRFKLAADELEADRIAEARVKRDREEAPAAPKDPAIRATGVLKQQAGLIANLERYEKTLFRSLLRAVHELRRLQAARAGQPVVPPVAVDVDVDV